MKIADSRHFALFAAVLILFMTAGAFAADDMAVSVTLERDTITMGEQATMLVVVTGGSQNLPAPQLPTLPTFEVYSQGRSSNISIVNGKVSSSLSYRYLLIPQKAGTFPIEQISVVFNNRRYKGNPVELTVLPRGAAAPDDVAERAVEPSGNTRDYFLEAVVDKKKPFVNEQVTLTLKFFVAVQYYGSPELTEPATTGFWTEVIGNKAPYYQRINDRRYKVIERKYALFPTQTGELTIGRAAIKATVPNTTKRRRDPFDMLGFDDFFGRGKEVTVRSQSLKVNVKPLPVEGRPDDFTGTIGSFRIRAVADKSEIEVNQAVTVTVSITGTGNIKSVGEPALPESEDFRIYRASSSENLSTANDRLGGTKVFEEVFIPRRPGEMQIPALHFNYFDPSQERYVTQSTRPITLRVTKPEGYVASSEVPYAPPGLTIGSEARDIRHILPDVGHTQPTGRLILLTPAYLAVNGTPLIFLALTVLLRRRREKLLGNVGYARSRGAAKVAKKRLGRARSLAGTENVGDFYAEIYQALTSYIADKLNISPHGLTTESIQQLLRDNGADEQLIADTVAIIGSCEFARFAPAQISRQDIDRALTEAERIMIGIEGVKFA